MSEPAARTVRGEAGATPFLQLKMKLIRFN
jgi:hypothetical protein